MKTETSQTNADRGKPFFFFFKKKKGSLRGIWRKLTGELKFERLDAEEFSCTHFENNGFGEYEI